MRPSDRQAVLALRLLLWPDDDGEDDPGETVLVWEQDGRVGGFVIYSLRPWAEGCEGRPVPYIEGWFVREDLRRRGVGRALVSAVEDRARAAGFRELGSDAPVANRVSLAAHRRLGFEPTEKLQFFRKNLTVVEPHAAVVVEPYGGSRAELLPLFAEADDSASEIRGYFELGEVFVARREQRIVGHVQLIASAEVWEIKSVAVVTDMQGQGIGAALIGKALDRAFSAGAARVVVATDIGNLRFYQRLGFRMDRVERDVFRPDRGYPNVHIDGIQVRDRVWFSIGVHAWRRLWRRH
jgi:GNAT superfamily N-acetyltransferase